MDTQTTQTQTTPVETAPTQPASQPSLGDRLDNIEQRLGAAEAGGGVTITQAQADSIRNAAMSYDLYGMADAIVNAFGGAG